jgi:hypothetical protein
MLLKIENVEQEHLTVRQTDKPRFPQLVQKFSKWYGA